MHKRTLNILKKIHPEVLIWISGILVLIFLVDSAEAFSICPFHNLGLTFCPGCGLGRSIGYLFIFDFKSSLAAHPFGIPAFLIILHRIFTLLKQQNHLSERNSHG
jgi:hypothetical protein